MGNPFVEPITILGETVFRGSGKLFGIKRSDRLFHTYIIGKTGTGKSTLLFNMMKSDCSSKTGFCLIDPHGDLAKKIAHCIPQDAIYWNLADPKCPFGYNPLAFVARQYRPLVASSILETLKKQWGARAWGVRMEHLLRYTLLALLEQPNSSLKDVMRMFTDKAFRTRVISNIQDEQVKCFWQEEYAAMNYKNAVDGVAPIANKLGGFLADPIIRKALCNPEEPLRFRQIIDEGRVLIVNLSKGTLGSDVANIVGGLISSTLGHAAYSRTNIKEHQRRPYVLYADEFHAFTTESFATMLSELRKYKLGLVLAHQYISQIDKKVLDAILGNVGTVISFRIGVNDARLFAKQLDDREPEDLINLPNYRVFIKLMIDGVVSKVFSARTLG